MSSKNSYVPILIIFVLFVAIGCAEQQIEQTPNILPELSKEKVVAADKDDKIARITDPKIEPIIEIITPNNGDLIKSSNVTVEVKAHNFEIVPIGSPVKDDEGHFHVWIDSEKRVTTESKVTFENVVSGKHSIVAELVKSNHSSLSPRITKSITINAESDFIPNAEQLQGTTEFNVEADDNDFYPNKLQAKIGDKVRINFKFRDVSIYFGGLDIRGPFEDINYKLKGEQPITREFTIKDETRVTSYWPASGVKKADLIVEVAK